MIPSRLIEGGPPPPGFPSYGAPGGPPLPHFGYGGPPPGYPPLQADLLLLLVRQDLPTAMQDTELLLLVRQERQAPTLITPAPMYQGHHPCSILTTCQWKLPRRQTSSSLKVDGNWHGNGENHGHGNKSEENRLDRDGKSR